MKLWIGVVLPLAVMSGNAMARDALTSQEKEIIMTAVKVKGDLKDPDSAQFRWVRLSADVDTNAPHVSASYCGLVNAKNSYGGYVGYRPYSATLFWMKGELIEPMIILSQDEGVAHAICRKFGYSDFSMAE